MRRRAPANAAAKVVDACIDMSHENMSRRYLGMIGVDRKEKLEALGRFRDCWLSPDATKVMILHRNYAANGDQEFLDSVAKWPGFLFNRETSDSTYAIFEFSVPAEMADLASIYGTMTEVLQMKSAFAATLVEIVSVCWATRNFLCLLCLFHVNPCPFFLRRLIV